MKVLFIGDIVGSPGREAVRRLVPDIRKREKIELVIANAENAAGGSGITPSIADELLGNGLDILTSGDHVWKRREILDIIDVNHLILRPANYPVGTPGVGFNVVRSTSDVEVAVINLVGRVFMNAVECPFRKVQEILQELKSRVVNIVVDIHAEATSEKLAMGWFLDGLVSAVVGTHTHVQTADPKIFPKGTAYITDVGMTGPYDSILGRRAEQILTRFLTQMPTRFEMATENVQLHGVIIDIDPKTGKAISIEPIQKKL